MSIILTLLSLFCVLHHVRGAGKSSRPNEDDKTREDREKLADLLPALAQQLSNQTECAGQQFFAIVLPPPDIDMFHLIPMGGGLVTDRRRIHSEGLNYVVARVEKNEQVSTILLLV